MKCLIIAGGTFPNRKIVESEIKTSDVIICADRGYDLIREFNLKPDFLLGDFDSSKFISKDDLNGVEIFKFNPEKDFTDTQLAIEQSIKLKPDEVTILAATGTRMDHSISNILLLKMYLENSIDAKILDDHNLISMKCGEFSVCKKNYKYFSIIPIYDETIITLVGFKYDVDKKCVNLCDSLTLSNEILEENAKVYLKKPAIIIQSND